MGTERAARPSRYGRWRAASLALVYVLMAVHIAHWRISGRTLAPLELNEVMYTLELGIVTAGFLFMLATVIATAIFGRFFCSWGCHILALEDLCAWLLGKLGIRPRPIRSRLLLFVPIVAILYMFVWPQIARVMVEVAPATETFFGARPAFELRVAGDEEGWASFVTTDFWRNLPGPWITVLTFLLCGFAIVYFLGSRSFCTYGCPYGVVFALADRVAPGRILLRGDCTDCGLCTAGCQSDIRVHEEVKRFGKVVSSRCLKDLDCVSVCPTGGLEFGYDKPAGFTSLGKNRVRPRYTLSGGEEGLVAFIVVATMVVFRGLYDAVPFLMTLGLAGVLAFLGVWSVRLYRRRSLWLHRTPLKVSGRITRAGRAFATVAACLGLFVIHSGFVRYHEVRGDSALRGLPDDAESPEATARLRDAVRHLEAVDRWGLFTPPTLVPRLAALNMSLGDAVAAERYLRRVAVTASHPAQRSAAYEHLSSLRAAAGDAAGATREMQKAVELDPRRSGIRLDLADLLVAVGRLQQAEIHLREVLRSDPASTRAHHNLAVVLANTGRVAEAEDQLLEAIRLDPDEAQLRQTLEALRAGRDAYGSGNVRR